MVKNGVSQDADGTEVTKDTDEGRAKELQALEREVKRLRSVNISLTRKWTDSAREAKELRSMLPSKECHSTMTLDKKLKTAEIERDSLKAMVQELQERCKTVEMERDTLKDTVQELQDRFGLLESDNHLLRDIGTHLEGRCVSAEFELEKARQLNEELETQTISWLWAHLLLRLPYRMVQGYSADLQNLRA
ncbi:hypothetical protein PQX77_018644 [Marasmius sp. AFHP31]|nr:hypothetical protein PQX77_018644 [Marasmius sp. AFHP31]